MKTNESRCALCKRPAVFQWGKLAYCADHTPPPEVTGTENCQACGAKLRTLEEVRTGLCPACET